MKTIDLSSWIQRFFQEYLMQQRSVSPATIGAYRDTFRLLLKFLQAKSRKAPSDLPLNILTVELVLGFLDHLEQTRGNLVRTRNARLAAIRSFVRYLNDWLGPELPAATRHILAIPFKRHVRPMIGYLRASEIQAILAAAGATWTGRRDHLLFLLLYNTGARVSEIIALRVRDLLSSDFKQAQLLGKGRKRRTIPLWRKTRTQVRQWIRENKLSADDPLLPNRFGQPLTRSGVAKQLREVVTRAAENCSALKKRSVSPHTFRHSMAMHMLESGVAAEIIALWLGHESPNTTHGYVEASLAMKRRALESVAPPKSKRVRFQPNDALLSFLENL